MEITDPVQRELRLHPYSDLQRPVNLVEITDPIQRRLRRLGQDGCLELLFSAEIDDPIQRRLRPNVVAVHFEALDCGNH